MAELTKERLSEIAAREAKATRGPWKRCAHLADEHVDSECGCGYRGGIWGADGELVICEMGGTPCAEDPQGDKLLPEAPREQQLADAAFITNARQDVPALLAEVERLRGLLAEAEMDWDGCHLEHCLDRPCRHANPYTEANHG